MRLRLHSRKPADMVHRRPVAELARRLTKIGRANHSAGCATFFIASASIA